MTPEQRAAAAEHRLAHTHRRQARWLTILWVTSAAALGIPAALLTLACLLHLH